MAPSPAAGGRRRRKPAACNNNPPAPGKRQRRTSTTSRPEPPPLSSPATALSFPVDVLLEIIARSNARTLVRCAALCKALRRDILSPAFLRRVTGGSQNDNPVDRIIPPRLLGYLRTYDKDKQGEDAPAAAAALFSLVHPNPATVPSAGSFSDQHLVPFISRSATDLLSEYKPVTSRGGLAVLRRRHVNLRKRSERRSDMCVYNPVTGERAFFPYPPGFWDHYYLHLGDVFALLTADDGIGSTFMLFMADLSGFQDCRSTIRVQTLWSDTGAWSPETCVGDVIRPWHDLEPWRDAVVFRGGLTLHWLANCCDMILTYDVATSKPGSIKLPADAAGCSSSKLHLGTSSDGRLRLLVVQEFVVSAWLLAAAGGGWELEAAINMETRLRSLCPEIAPDGPVLLEFVSSGERSGVALLRIGRAGSSVSCGWHIVLDVETREMRKIWGPYWNYLLVELDLPSRLQSMKIF